MSSLISKSKFKKAKKVKALRHNEYYEMQPTFDYLYSKSIKNENFKKLMPLIMSEKNIMLAYRNIKANKGSKTNGTDNLDINYIKEMSQEDFVKMIQDKMINYNPQPIRRVEIPKNDGTGRTRPLGIPTIKDRIIQQAIKQILDPICEAKFYNHSYGFRSNRSTTHALARVNFLINKAKMTYCVDIDIKGFFDNVNHQKLIQQIWSLGIRDKQLICIIKKMLKAPIDKEGIPEKGTPQGGILSPLLSNIVLNELDWWIANQWENFPTKHNYKGITDKYRALMKGSKLKKMFIVRYADDFKIMCTNHNDAVRIFNAVKKWLKNRLGLDISPTKSKITNLKKDYTEFLGYRIKAVRKGNKYVAYSMITKKKEIQIANNLKIRLRALKKNQDFKTIQDYNSYVMGIHQYFKYTTHVSKSCSKIALRVYKIYSHVGNSFGKKGIQNLRNQSVIKKFYGEYLNRKSNFSINGILLIPIGCIKHSSAMSFTQEICNYTKNGREFKHKKVSDILMSNVKYILDNNAKYESVEYNDLRISLYLKQQGKCAITGKFYHPKDMELHHKIPRSKGGKDESKNLIYINKNIHKIVHSTNPLTVEKLFKNLGLSMYMSETEKINEYRKKVELGLITPTNMVSNKLGIA